jgi:release factor glutamine methyltransferase
VKVADLLAWGEKVIASSPAIDHWERMGDRHDAENLLRHVVGESLDRSAEVPIAVRRRYERLVDRRATGEPIPYITGTTSFRGLTLTVRPGVFIPRDSTEWLAEQAVLRLRRTRNPIVVDVGTGMGPVALAIAHEVPRAVVVGTDISAPGIALARANARRLGLAVRFVVGDLFAAVPLDLAARVHVVTAHMPYIGRAELSDVPDELVRFEPLSSLTDETPLGLELLGRVSNEARDWLRPGGWLLVEVASDRSRKVAAMLRRAGYGEVGSTRGAMPWARVVAGRARSRASHRVSRVTTIR